MDLNFERKLFLFPLKSYGKVRNLSISGVLLCRRNASVSHFSDFDVYKEYAPLYCSFQRKNRDSSNFKSIQTLIVRFGHLWQN